MMLLAPFVSTVLLLIVATSGAAWDEPDSFRGIPWGTSMEVARRLLEEKGEKPDCVSNRLCQARVNIGAVHHVLAQYGFTDDKFSLAILRFSPRDYDALRTIFSERYGQPSTIRDEEVKTRVGVVYTNQIATWAGERVVIDLRRYDTNVNQGRAMISLKALLDKGREETEKAIKKGKDDL